MNDEFKYPFKRGRFTCKPCENLFYAVQDGVFPVLEDEGSVYKANCPGCGAPVVETSSMQNLHKSLGTAKGANMSSQAREKTRLNGYKNGSLTSQVKDSETRIPLPPAKPGKYAECDDCMDLEECAAGVEDKRGTSIPVFCHRKAEVALKFSSAFMSGDPASLRLIAAQNAANMQMLLNNCIKAIFEKGVQLIETEYRRDGLGKPLEVPGRSGEYDITERITAHPLIKRCIELAATMGFTLGDWSMTPKSKEANPQIEGFLAGLGVGGATAAKELADAMKETVDDFKAALVGATAARENDQTHKSFIAEEAKREAEENGK